ncbi:Uncharacterized membrane protein [Oceanobacillus limi]|uniref:Uncharacterized membrane protein n=1 Tax=Oceanobacillus limi TaxID=930131 RepID=A0A1I0C5I9_9BACI|nr:DUF2157 domain-containing protein [Oceanobacillus limi]SET14168.1 Uncharacterized membrane protein [Oceanobacillus limi]
MNKTKLKQEGKKWVAEGIISEQQLERILETYKQKDPNFIIIVFAVLLTGLGFLTFIMSDWAQVAHFSRVFVILAAIVGLYILGDILYRKRSELLGVSFVILGYIVFGAGMLLILNIYTVELFSAWPFLIWSVIGLLLYFIYEHKLIFVVGLLVTTAGQIYSGMEFASFSWLILIVFIVGYTHFVYHHANYVFSYLFAISFSLQMVVLTIANAYEYYWLIVLFLALYVIGELLPKEILKKTFQYISLLSIFLFGMYQSFLLQESFFIQDMNLQTSFIIVWGLAILGTVILKLLTRSQLELIDLVLFLPICYLPFSYVLGLVSLFIFSIAWLLLGYRKEDHEKVLLGTVSFLLSTFTVYIQFGWDAMNKSLFFLVGGILLFSISFFLEKQRRAIVDSNKGGNTK